MHPYIVAVLMHRTLMKDWQNIEPIKMVEVFSLFRAANNYTAKRVKIIKKSVTSKGLKNITMNGTGCTFLHLHHCHTY